MSEFKTNQKTERLAQRLAEQEAAKQAEIAELKARHDDERAAIEAEQAAHDAAIADALANAGTTRASFVEDLYDHFGIEAEPMAERRNKKTGEVMRKKNGGAVMVNPDKDESKRIARLAEAIAEVIRKAEDVVIDDTDDVVEQVDEHDDDDSGVTSKEFFDMHQQSA